MLKTEEQERETMAEWATEKSICSGILHGSREKWLSLTLDVQNCMTDFSWFLGQGCVKSLHIF